MQNKRILAISDVHGQHHQLVALLSKAKYCPEDTLIIIGDMLDRGYNNLLTLEECLKLEQQGAILLKGNHERFVQDCIAEMLYNPDYPDKTSPYFQAWVLNYGGATMFKEIRNSERRKLEKIHKFVSRLHPVYILEEYIFAHAGINPDKALEECQEDDFIWPIKTFYQRPAYAGKIVVFGHIPAWVLQGYPFHPGRKDVNIWYDALNNDKIGIDGGNVFGGRLTCLVLPAMTEYYV